VKTQIELAREIATKAHEGQIRKRGIETGWPYIVHPESVSKMVSHVPILVAAAWLHDVLEDTKVTEDDLRQAGIQQDVIDIVKMVTRGPNENYFDFIMRIKENSLALTLKAADIRNNLENLEECSLKDKYRFAHYVLTM
jgi:(p)ppGpp synthase/HD superfamily hydrolase